MKQHSNPPDVKKCACCGAILPVTQFSAWINHGHIVIRGTCKACLRAKKRLWNNQNRSKIRKYASTQYAQNIANWLAYFRVRHGEHPVCEICGKTLTWRNGHRVNNMQSVNFDHHKQGVPIKGNPSAWYAYHICNDKNQKIFESCHFGILCLLCNRALTMSDRLQWAHNIINYCNKQNHLWKNEIVEARDYLERNCKS